MHRHIDNCHMGGGVSRMRLLCQDFGGCTLAIVSRLFVSSCHCGRLCGVYCRDIEMVLIV